MDTLSFMTKDLVALSMQFLKMGASALVAFVVDRAHPHRNVRSHLEESSDVRGAMVENRFSKR